MKNKPLYGFYINPAKHTAQAIAINDTLSDFYEKLECDLIDVTRRRIGGTLYDIVCDDEGLLKEKPLPSALFVNGSVGLVGPLFVCHGNDFTGEFEDITEDEADDLFQRVVVYNNPDGGEMCCALLLDTP